MRVQDVEKSVCETPEKEQDCDYSTLSVCDRYGETVDLPRKQGTSDCLSVK